MTSVVRLDGVTRRFDTPAETVTAVDDVTLTVSAGEFVGLVGPSGSGKTTALNLIVGWESPDEGTVSRHIAHAGWRGLAVVPQELGLLPELTARENVELAARLVPGPGAGHGHDTNGGSGLGDLFEALGLAELAERFPDELSMGEQQRLAVARAVALEPELLIADEPTAHQDEQRADLVMDRLVAVAAGGGAVIVATHDLRLLARVDREIRMLDGRISDLTVARHSRR